MDQSTVDEYLKSVYYDPKRAGSFRRIESLHRDVKQEEKFKLSRKQISDWLFSQDTYPRANGAKRRSGRQLGARVLIPRGY